MENISLVNAVGKLALLGQRAGFSIEQMIELLEAGISVEALLQLIAAVLGPESTKESMPSCTRCIM